MKHLWLILAFTFTLAACDAVGPITAGECSEHNAECEARAPTRDDDEHNKVKERY